MMRVLCLLLTVLLAVPAAGQVAGSHTAAIKIGSPLGVLFNDSFDGEDGSPGDDYTISVTSPAAISVVSSKLRLTSTRKAVTDTIKYDVKVTAAEDWKIELSFVAVDKDANSSGLYLGISDYQDSNTAGTMMGIDLTSTGDAKIGINYYTNTASSALATDSTGVGFTAGDSFYAVFERSGFTYTATLTNVSTSTTRSINYTFSMAYPQTVYSAAGGMFTLCAIGGTQDVSNWTVTRNSRKNTTALFVGDSITEGYYVGADYTDRFSDLACGYLGWTCVNIGKSGAITADVAGWSPEIYALKPDRVFLMVGGNDLDYGKDWTSNYPTLVTDIKGMIPGVKVIHLWATPRDSEDMRPFNGWIDHYVADVAKSEDRIIDTFSPLLGSGAYDLGATYDCGDGVHPGGDGHTAIAQTIRDNVRGTYVKVDDYYSKDNQAADSWIYAGAPYHSQSFTADASGVLDHVTLYLKKTGSPTGNMVVQIYAHSGTYGTNSRPSGTLDTDKLAESEAFDVSALNTTYRLFPIKFTGANRITLTASTHYCLVIKYTGGDGSNVVHNGLDNSSPSHDGNNAYYDGSWHDDENDHIFYIFTVR